MNTELFECTDITFDILFQIGVDGSLLGVYRETWGVYRDRRPDQYAALMTMDGRV